MKVTKRAFLVAGALLLAPHAHAQSKQGLAQQWGLVVFPAKNQTKDQQEQDEFACYKWAKDNTGIDPLAPPPPPPPADPNKPPAGSGAVVKGAAGGAVAGTAVGAVAGDAGKGAAIGATAGALAGAKKKKAAQQQAAAQSSANAQAATQQRQATFNKGFSACLEGKGYTVK
jgi:hypothetical protein